MNVIFCNVLNYSHIERAVHKRKPNPIIQLQSFSGDFQRRVEVFVFHGATLAEFLRFVYK